MTAAVDKQVATRPPRRYRTKQERRRIAEEALEPGVRTAVVAKSHGVRASQVNHWKRLYKQGLLEVEASVSTLLPVRIADSKGKVETARPRQVLVESQPAGGRAAVGTIHLTLEKALLQIDGAADPCCLRLVLQHLLG